MKDLANECENKLTEIFESEGETTEIRSVISLLSQSQSSLNIAELNNIVHNRTALVDPKSIKAELPRIAHFLTLLNTFTNFSGQSTTDVVE